MTETGNQLLREILSTPDDDTVRLVYADWLEENGQADRAEFIRVQIELFPHQSRIEWLEQMPVEQWSGDADMGDLLRRLDPLVRRHTELCRLHVRDCGTWSREFIRGVLGPKWLQLSVGWQWGWSRGFIATIDCSAGNWLKYADVITLQQPITTVNLTTWPENNLPTIMRLRNWKVPPRLGDNILDCWHSEWPGITFTIPQI